MFSRTIGKNANQQIGAIAAHLGLLGARVANAIGKRAIPRHLVLAAELFELGEAWHGGHKLPAFVQHWGVRNWWHFAS